MPAALSLKLAWLSALLSVALLACWGWEYSMHQGTKVELATLKTANADAATAPANALTQATTRVLNLERALTDAHNLQEEKDADAQRILAAERRKLRDMSRAGGGAGLRDPHASSGSCGATSSGAAPSDPGGAEDPAEARGLLSGPLEQLLLELTDEADEINRAYASCRADAVSVRLAR